jgi:hypothetical protein
MEGRMEGSSTIPLRGHRNNVAEALLGNKDNSTFQPSACRSERLNNRPERAGGCMGSLGPSQLFIPGRSEKEPFREGK